MTTPALVCKIPGTVTAHLLCDSEFMRKSLFVFSDIIAYSWFAEGDGIFSVNHVTLEWRR